MKHLILTGLIDDISIGNAYASEEELKEMAEAFNADYPTLKVDTEEGITETNESAYLTTSTVIEETLRVYPSFDDDSCIL